jgi:hypothetical protein
MLWRAGRDEDQPCAVDDDGVFAQIVFSMSDAASQDRAAGGWLRMAATFFYPVGTMTCDSGRVPFAVGATSARPS